MVGDRQGGGGQKEKCQNKIIESVSAKERERKKNRERLRQRNGREGGNEGRREVEGES